MATSLRLFTPLRAFPLKPHSGRYSPKSIPISAPNCSPSANPIPETETTSTTPTPTTNQDSDDTFNTPTDTLSATDPSLAISKRVPSGISLRTGPVICPLEPPNFEIGWKRTKEIKIEKPKGWLIADFMEKLEGLMSRGRYGSPKLLAKTMGIVAERAREEADVLRAKGEVDDRVVTELQRVLRLVELDAEMVKAAVKEETLKERIEMAQARCQQAILVALSL
ncbi:Chlororespiratory reduction 41 [Rhynchospora pubera]|uniref:Chlororespiratory reduction 41 n=1 Tax=Rhynchospora pubera TaxID=906938 RepID=A0AAV8DC82_9POAL|nr:Chlororespiratory reduction 41 [Rhynchospora pubera]